MTPSMGLFELLYITDCARTFSGSSATPVVATLPGQCLLDAACLDYLGMSPTLSDSPCITFSAKDAELPLITRGASLWEALEPSFIKQHEDRMGTGAMSGRVKRTLTAALPGGSLDHWIIDS